MGDVRVCRNVAVYARCGGWGVWGRCGSGGGSGAGMDGRVEGVCWIREIWGEGKERKRDFLLFSFIGRFVDVWERWRDGFSIGIVFDMGKRRKGKRIIYNLQKY